MRKKREKKRENKTNIKKNRYKIWKWRDNIIICYIWYRYILVRQKNIKWKRLQRVLWSSWIYNNILQISFSSLNTRHLEIWKKALLRTASKWWNIQENNVNVHVLWAPNLWDLMPKDWGGIDVIILEINYTISIMHLNHPETTTLHLRKNCLLQNQSLVPEILETTEWNLENIKKACNRQPE